MGECVVPEKEGYIIINDTTTCTPNIQYPEWEPAEGNECASAITSDACEAIVMDCASWDYGEGCPTGCDMGDIPGTSEVTCTPNIQYPEWEPAEGNECASAMTSDACEAIVMDCASWDSGEHCPTGCDMGYIPGTSEVTCTGTSTEPACTSEVIPGTSETCTGTSTEPACTSGSGMDLNTDPELFNVQATCDTNNFYEPFLFWKDGEANICKGKVAVPNDMGFRYKAGVKEADGVEYRLSGCHKHGDLFIFALPVVIAIIYFIPPYLMRWDLELLGANVVREKPLIFFIPAAFVILTITIRSIIERHDLNETYKDQADKYKYLPNLTKMTKIISVVPILIFLFFYIRNSVWRGPIAPVQEMTVQAVAVNPLALD
jgi:hypothetical protein